MRFFLILIFWLIATCAWANESHSPRYKCQFKNQEDIFVLIGNKFPQIPDLDWSHEIYLATAQEYLDGSYRNNELYTISQSTRTEITAINLSKPEQILVLSELSLQVREGETLKSYRCKYQSFAD